MIEVKIKNLKSHFLVRTAGLTSLADSEISVEVAEASLVPMAEEFLQYVSNYLASSGKQIRSGETLAYGYWLVKFEAADDGSLETWEYNAQATAFVRGANLTLIYWRDQHFICDEHQAEFRPPRPDRLIVVSKGVLEGMPVEGVRYPSPEHMSGWWLTTDEYDGNIESLRHHHIYHVTAARPELAKYVALPEGFRFKLANRAVEVWFDESVLRST
jgi:hypothetical protein